MIKPKPKFTLVPGTQTFKLPIDHPHGLKVEAGQITIANALAIQNAWRTKHGDAFMNWIEEHAGDVVIGHETSFRCGFGMAHVPSEETMKVFFTVEIIDPDAAVHIRLKSC